MFVQNSAAVAVKAAVRLVGRGFPGGAVVKNPPANPRGIRDTGLIPGLG